MGRALSAALDAAMDSNTRKPGFIVQIFDIRSTSQEITPTRINDVVLFNLGLGSLPAIVGPRDFTNDTVSVSVTETAGDYVDNGVAASSIQGVIVDPDATLDPISNPAPADGRWLRQGNVVVIREGDFAAPTSDWPITFTGAIQGQPGQSRNRTTGRSQLTFKANSREVDFLRQVSVSREFVQNETFAAMITELAEVDMGLASGEIDFPSFTSRLTSFSTTQFVDESPLVSIAKVMFPDGFMPKFVGNGQLSATDGSITKSPTRFYTDSQLQITIDRPIIEQNGINEVELIGLDPIAAQIVQQRQLLARASITTGFFSNEARIDVSWSDDRTQQALDPVMEVDSSVADGIFNFGGEDFSATPNPDDGGSVEGIIEVDGGLGASIILAALVAVAWISSQFIPDAVVVAGVGASTGITIPLGRPISGAVGQTLFTILAKVGRGQYRIMGRPYEYVYQEIRCVARVSGLRSEDIRPVRIENHLINSASDCDDAAERVLRRELAKQNTRRIRMLHDLAVVPDDIIEVGSGTTARRFAVRSIQRVLQHGGRHEARLDCFETTIGVFP